MNSVNKTSFRYYFFDLFKNVRSTESQNVLHFGMKCSKSRRFLGLRVLGAPRSGAYDAIPDPLVVKGFLPSAIAFSRLRRLIQLKPPKQKSPPRYSPPKHKILEPVLPANTIFIADSDHLF